MPEQRECLIGGKNCLVGRPVRQSHAALKPIANGTNGLQDDRLGKVAGQRKALSDWELLRAKIHRLLPFEPTQWEKTLVPFPYPAKASFGKRSEGLLL